MGPPPEVRNMVAMPLVLGFENSFIVKPAIGGRHRARGVGTGDQSNSKSKSAKCIRHRNHSLIKSLIYRLQAVGRCPPACPGNWGLIGQLEGMIARV